MEIRCWLNRLKTIQSGAGTMWLDSDADVRFRSAQTDGSSHIEAVSPVGQIFSETLMYADDATPCYNGNISSRIFPGGEYNYTYDKYNRLTKATFVDPSGSGRDYTTQYAYNKMSAVTSLMRFGISDRVGTTNTYSAHTDLVNSYTGTQLTGVSNYAAGADYEGRTGLGTYCEASLTYDSNGNVSSDGSHNIESISYNHLNQPLRITFSDGSSIVNSYGTDGQKWRMVCTTREGRSTTHYYLGDAVLVGGKVTQQCFPGGYYDAPYSIIVEEVGAEATGALEGLLVAPGIYFGLMA